MTVTLSSQLELILMGWVKQNKTQIAQLFAKSLTEDTLAHVSMIMSHAMSVGHYIKTSNDLIDDHYGDLLKSMAFSFSFVNTSHDLSKY